MQSLALYTADAVLVDLACKPLSGDPLSVLVLTRRFQDNKGTNVDIPGDVVDLLTDDEVRRITAGSKAQIAAWYTYTGLICKRRS